MSPTLQPACGTGQAFSDGPYGMGGGLWWVVRKGMKGLSEVLSASRDRDENSRVWPKFPAHWCGWSIWGGCLFWIFRKCWHGLGRW